MGVGILELQLYKVFADHVDQGSQTRFIICALALATNARRDTDAYWHASVVLTCALFERKRGPLTPFHLHVIHTLALDHAWNSSEDATILMRNRPYHGIHPRISKTAEILGHVKTDQVMQSDPAGTAGKMSSARTGLHAHAPSIVREASAHAQQLTTALAVYTRGKKGIKYDSIGMSGTLTFFEGPSCVGRCGSVP